MEGINGNEMIGSSFKPEFQHNYLVIQEKGSSANEIQADAKMSRSRINEGSIKRSPTMPRRPLSAYNCFFREQRAILLSERSEKARPKPKGNVDMTPQQKRKTGFFARMGKAIGQRWKKVAPEDLKRFKAMAAQDTIRYKREMEEYKQNVSRYVEEGAQEMLEREAEMHETDGTDTKKEEPVVTSTPESSRLPKDASVPSETPRAPVSVQQDRADMQLQRIQQSSSAGDSVLTSSFQHRVRPANVLHDPTTSALESLAGGQFVSYGARSPLTVNSFLQSQYPVSDPAPALTNMVLVEFELARQQQLQGHQTGLASSALAAQHLAINFGERMPIEATQLALHAQLFGLPSAGREVYFQNLERLRAMYSVQVHHGIEY